MEQRYSNIYKNARVTAGLTQERWAEMIGVSPDSIRKYEGGSCIPSDDVAARMAEISGMTVLGYWHLKQKSGVANDLLPDVELVPLPQAVVQLLSELNDLEEKKIVPELLSIARDGEIDREEQPYFDKILLELDDVVRAALAVKYSQWKGGADEHGGT